MNTREQVDIILLDDDKDICVMVQAMLNFSGYKVQSLSLPHQLNELLVSLTPRMLLMDMLLSGTDGRDVCRRLKNDADTRHIKIMMMSAHPDADRSCREAGADDFISKPFDMDQFIAKVKSQLAF
ncbi:MAG TPA: response regulator [Chitinophagaceae bacterium]|nr:response regulator [Chitinophagaceae bacterium]